MALARLATLWIGDRLSWFEQLCLKSFVDAGHEITLYSYGDIANCPDGVKRADAQEIFPAEPLYVHKITKSPAIHADLWRLQLLKQTDLIWIDADMYCYRPFEFESEYVFGWENPDVVCNAVFGLPSDSATLSALLDYFEDEYAIPPWFRPEQQEELRREKEAGNPVHLTELPWAATGPGAATYFLKQTGEISHALGEKVFYPVGFGHRRKLCVARHRAFVDEAITDETLGIHFWARRVKAFLEEKCDNVPYEGSLMYELMRKHEIDPQAALIEPKKRVQDERAVDPNFKARVALEVISGEKTLDGASRQYRISRGLIKGWTKKLKSGAPSLFSSDDERG